MNSAQGRPMRGTDGPLTARHIEFTGATHAEMFRIAADWFAANDGEVNHILATGVHKLREERDPDIWYALSVAYD